MRLSGGPRSASWRRCHAWRALLVPLSLALLPALLAPGSAAAAAPAARAAGPCPWAAPEAAARATPTTLADEVLAHMDLAEKLTLLALAPGDGYENRVRGIRALCLPPFTLQDGPDGLSAGDRGATQLPSSLGVAASFDPTLAERYGAVQGAEARGQGIDVVQGPNLNIDRVPESGRAFEGYGEDPYLVSVMGDADIEGIQSAGVLADAKHFTAYNQETDRAALNEQVGERALQEIYLAPFRAAVTVAHVASIMCSYGEVNGVNDCSDPALFKELYQGWGFTGFVRSDLRSVTSPPLAFAAGLDLIKPAATAVLRSAFADRIVKPSRLDDAVRRLLEAEFTFQLIEHPLTGRSGAEVATAAHARFALRAAEESMVLLKDSGVLPLSTGHLASLAVIGAAASTAPVAAGGGSAYVRPPFVSRPLAAIAAIVGPRTKVRYVAAGTAVQPFSPISPSSLHSFSFTGPAPLALHGQAAGLLARQYAPTGFFPASLEHALSEWSARVSAPASGHYDFSVTATGNAWLSVGGKLLLSTPGTHQLSTWTVPVFLVKGRPTAISLRYYPSSRGAVPVVGWRSSGADIAAAVRAAAHASAAVVFVNDANAEGSDRPSLRLPGDENALVEAVAAVNRHTVVVLDTGGPVLMPWLGDVAAVLEAWYPGEQDGAATAAVLFGASDPSGHLPVTFPAANGAVPAHSPATWPGVAGTVSYSEGLEVGYRYQQAHGLTPLFPFGFGLSYTRFSESGLRVVADADGGEEAVVTVRNLGRRAGTDVVQAYLAFPPAAGEPPEQLKAFVRVPLAAHAATTVTLDLPASAFTAYLNGRWQALPGQYTLSVGESSADLGLRASVFAPGFNPGAPAVAGGAGASPSGGGAATSGASGSSSASGAAVGVTVSAARRSS